MCAVRITKEKKELVINAYVTDAFSVYVFLAYMLSSSVLEYRN